MQDCGCDLCTHIQGSFYANPRWPDEREQGLIFWNEHGPVFSQRQTLAGLNIIFEHFEIWCAEGARHEFEG